MNEGAQNSARYGRYLAALVLLPTVLAVLAATLGPIASGDLFWHLRTGEWILEHGTLPTTDPFSHTAGDTHWVLQEYGSQVLFAFAFKLAGFTGLKLLGALLSVTILAVVYRRARIDLRRSWAAGLTAAFALLFALKWELRPQLFSLLFFFWLERALFPRDGGLTTPRPRRWLELALLSMVWVQLHAEALFAPMVSFAVFVGALIAALCKDANWRHTAAWFAMAAAALLGTLASPLFAEPHIYALVGRAVPQEYIEEWFRPWVLPGDIRFAPMTLGLFVTYLLSLFSGGLFALGALVSRFKNRVARPSGLRLNSSPAISFERLAFLGACLLFALSARRFLWLTWFPLLDMLVWSLRSRPRLCRSQVIPGLASLALGATLLFTHYPQAAWSAYTRGFAKSTVDPGLFPSFATDFMVKAGIQGKLYHPYEWGGYLGALTQQPVFIDGRTVLFEKIIKERWIAEHDPNQRRQIFQARGVEVIIFDHFMETLDGLRPWKPGGENWIAVWTDNRAVVWIQRGSPNEQRAQDWWAKRGVKLDLESGITTADINLAQPDWLEQRLILPPEIVKAIRAVETQPGADDAKSVLGRSQLWSSMGMKRNQNAELRRAARSASKQHATSLNRMLRQNDLTGFIEFMQQKVQSANDESEPN